jgi:hypothetical protein
VNDGPRQEVSTGNIDARGNVTVAPSQTIIYHGDERQREWAEALMRGPIEALDLTEPLDQAERFAAAGEHEQAAQRLLEIARKLKESGYVAAGDSYLDQAARGYDLGGDRPRALAFVLESLRSRFARDDQHPDPTLDLLRQLAGEDQWLADGMDTAFRWPEVHPSALQTLADAAEKAAGRDDEAWWAAVAAEHLGFAEECDAAITATAPACSRIPLGSGPRLALELDVLDAIEHRDGVEPAEERWDSLLDWVDDLGARQPADVALVWQRRSVTLAYREDNEGSRRAALKAIQAWSRVPGHQDQAAEAFFTHRAVRQVLGEFPLGDSEIASFAAELRGSVQTPAALADRHELAGLHSRIEDKPPDARRRLMQALRLHRRVGNLRGQFAIAGELAELYEHVGEPGAALGVRIERGDSKSARRLAATIPPAEVARVVRLAGPRWERRASYAAADARLLEMDDDTVARLGRPILDEAEAEATTPWGDDPVRLARLASMNLVLAAHRDLQERALNLARDISEPGNLDYGRRAMRALLDVTAAGVVDEASRIADDFLNEHGTQSFDFAVISALAETRPHLADRLREAARGGYRPALEAVAAGDLIGDDRALLIACSQAVTAMLAIETHTETEHERQVGMVSFEASGLLGRFCDDPLRVRLVHKLLEVATDPEDLELTRASAANALLNLGEKVPSSEVRAAFDALEPLAHGAYDRSRWDQETEASLHPFSRWRVGLSVADALRGAALQTAGRLAARDGDLRERTQAVADGALTSGRPAVVAAGLDVVARIRDLSLPIPLALFFNSNDVAVRLGALKAFFQRHGPPGDELIERLVDDPEPRVRLALRACLRDAGHARALRALQDDAHARVRSLVVHDLDELERRES